MSLQVIKMGDVEDPDFDIEEVQPFIEFPCFLSFSFPTKSTGAEERKRTDRRAHAEAEIDGRVGLISC